VLNIISGLTRLEDILARVLLRGVLIKGKVLLNIFPRGIIRIKEFRPDISSIDYNCLFLTKELTGLYSL
jgi:hypothetical protein